MTEPIEVGQGSKIDRIMAGLVSQGYTEGTVADRERQRLLDKTQLSHGTILDLYREAGEEARIVGE